jgi:hypothetical protein
VESVSNKCNESVASKLELIRALQESVNLIEKIAWQECREAEAAAVSVERERSAQAVIDYSMSYPFGEDARELFADCAEFLRSGGGHCR